MHVLTYSFTLANIRQMIQQKLVAMLDLCLPLYVLKVVGSHFVILHVLG